MEEGRFKKKLFAFVGMQTEGYHVKAPEKDVHVLGRQREKKVNATR